MLTRNVFKKPYSSSFIRFVHQHQSKDISSISLPHATLPCDGNELKLVRGSGLRHGVEHKNLALGLRSIRPPDSLTSNSKKTPKKEPNEEVEVSDAEWEVRTGRALFVLGETLPEFFKNGLVTHVDKASGAPITSSSVLPLSTGNALEMLTQGSYSSTSGDVGAESIYSPKVKLEYTPPTALPTPFPRTLHIEGLPLYLASASFMRHTMKTLYSDLLVTLLKVSLNAPPCSGLNEEGQKKRVSREKSVVVRLMVTGTARVGGGVSEWEVESAYIFSPLSGLIHKQVINSIHPTPHQAVYDSLSKLFGFGWTTASGSGQKGPAPGTLFNDNSK